MTFVRIAQKVFRRFVKYVNCFSSYEYDMIQLESKENKKRRSEKGL